MKVNSINNNINFGAIVRISEDKAAKALLTGGLSTIGSGLSATGSLASAPIFDAAHHIHDAAKVVDSSSALSGVGSGFAGGYCFKKAIDVLKIPTRKMPK